MRQQMIVLRGKRPVGVTIPLLHQYLSVYHYGSSGDRGSGYNHPFSSVMNLS